MPGDGQSIPLIAALQFGDTISKLDHLIPLCDLLNAPLLLDSSFSYELAKRYYPPTRLVLINPQEYLSYLSNFDFFFVSDKYSSCTLQTVYNLLCHRDLYFFYCPHGNSDKGFINRTMNQLDFHNLSLIYGEQMRQRIHNLDLCSQIHALVTMGNLRKRFYLKYYTFFTNIVKNSLNLPKKSRYTFLYAPSWQDAENSTSFFTICKHLIEDIPPSDYLIIKIHPLLLTHNLGYVTHVCEKYTYKKNVQFIQDNPLVYPLLEHIDIYLGDISSVGYDFLFFNRPMFFFDRRINPPIESKTLFQCGIEVPPQYFKNAYFFIFSRLEENRKRSAIRNEVYNFVFAKDPTDYELKRNIVNAYQSLKIHKQIS